MCHAVKRILITVSGALHCCVFIPSKVRQIAVICCILHNLALRTDLCNSGAQSVAASDLHNSIRELGVKNMTCGNQQWHWRVQLILSEFPLCVNCSLHTAMNFCS